MGSGCGIKPLCLLQTPQVYMAQECKQVPFPCIKNLKPTTCYKQVCVNVPKTRMVDNQDCITKHNIYNACVNSVAEGVSEGYTEIPPIETGTGTGGSINPNGTIGTNGSPNGSPTGTKLNEAEQAEMKKKIINYILIGLAILFFAWLAYYLYNKFA